MDVSINGQDIKITEALEEYAQRKLGKLDRYMPNITDLRLDLSRQHTRRGDNLTIAQITLRHRRGAILRAEEKINGEDNEAMQAAITAAVDKMYRRIQRFKGKKQDNRRGREKYFATPEELTLAEELPELDYEAIAEEYNDDYYEEETAIVRRKLIEIEAMTELEAIEQMELLGHGFFMFKNQDSGAINVLYRRDNGGYGVLVPENNG